MGTAASEHVGDAAEKYAPSAAMASAAGGAAAAKYLPHLKVKVFVTAHVSVFVKCSPATRVPLGYIGRGG